MQWMDKYEAQADYNIAETCAASVSISELLSLSEKADASAISTTTKLTYGSTRGSDALRNNLSALYSARASSPLTKDDILITPGAISANFLVLYSLLSAGDHVICHYPTYSQLYQVPRSLGASVSLWKADPAAQWQVDVSTLKSLIQPEGHTKLLILNNPNNPTGSIIPKQTLEEIVSLAAQHHITILSDEVYRPLFHSISPSSPDFPPSALNILPSSHTNNVVVTGSASKSYSLAGIRIGWIACRNPVLIERLAASRHFTTISVSQLDDSVAATALSDHCIHALLARNLALAKTNLQLLEAFVEEHRWACSWVRPVAGTTAFIRFARNGRPVDDVAFCEKLIQSTGVMVVPGRRCFEDRGDGDGTGTRNGEFAGYVRIGFVNSTEVLQAALTQLRKFMQLDKEEGGFESVPVLARLK